MEREVSGCQGWAGTAGWISAFMPHPGSAVVTLVVVDEAQLRAGSQQHPAPRPPPARPLLTQSSGISSSTPGSTASRCTLTSATGDRWSWTCRSGEPSCSWGQVWGAREHCGNSQVEDGVAGKHSFGVRKPLTAHIPLHPPGLEHKVPAGTGRSGKRTDGPRGATTV